MSEFEHRFIETNGIRLHVAEAGRGPLVLLLHGFPECWYSWRHQLSALADAGFHVVAPDQRGYARSERPAAAEDYTMAHLTGDVIGLIDALGEEKAAVVGHDWGAPVAWHTALFRPDRVRGVAGLSVPHAPRGSVPPLTAMRAAFGESFYMNYFQQPGRADEELAADPADAFRRLLVGLSGDADQVRPMLVPPGKEFTDLWPWPETLPHWLTEHDLETYVAEYAEAGFTGGLNWYRNLNRNWELTAAWKGARIAVPALFVGGDRDPVLAGRTGEAIEATLRAAVPGLTRSVLLPGGGHWLQQERPAEVNAALLQFLQALP
ncbi:alpha/beta fold hydrolase [Amycolatopsis nigrescens]|uniref:alpha/beta fold hydrolase n=1 Tax=Amycolatopsis nigrescens TaxID=381445 RepID=UPI0003691EF0|nr:alpha/beta hydrolase [Amycolatopsis nigrescens]